MNLKTEESINAGSLGANRWWTRRAPLLLGFLVVVGTALRLIALGHKSFWLDEIASVAICLRPSASFWDWVWRHEGNMALYYLLLRPWLHLGLSEGTVRLLSVIPGVLTIPMMYLLGKRLLSGEAGMLAALMVALSPCALVYSQEARGYSLLVLAVTVATYLFVGLVEKPTAGTAVAYAVAAAITLYCHYFGLLAIAAHFASLLTLSPGRISWRYVSLAVVLIAVLGAPVAWMIHVQDAAHISWVPSPSLLELYHLGVFLAAEGGKALGVALLVVELPLLVLFLRRFASLEKYRPSIEFWKYSVVASGLFTPIAISLVVSIMKPVFFHRFLIICLPAWLLMIAEGVALIPKVRQRVLATAAVCLLSSICIVQSYSRVREDWRAVASLLIRNAQSQDRVLYYLPVAFFGAETYRDWLPGGKANRPQAFMVNGDEVELRREMDSPERIWLVRYPANLNDAQMLALQSELSLSYRPQETIPFRAITVTEYLRK